MCGRSCKIMDAGRGFLIFGCGAVLVGKTCLKAIVLWEKRGFWVGGVRARCYVEIHNILEFCDERF